MKKQRMKILFINDIFDPTINSRARAEAKELAKNNEVYVLSTTMNTYLLKEKSFNGGVKKILGFTVIRKKPFLRIRDFILWIREYKKVIRSINPDIVFVFDGARPSHGIMGLWAKKKGYPIFYEQGKWSRYEFRTLSKIKNFIIGNYLERKILKKSDIIYTTLKEAKIYLLKYYPFLKEEDITLGSSGYNENFFSSKKKREAFRKKQGIKEEEYVFGTTGKFTKDNNKHPELIISAFKEIPEKKTRLILAGQFEEKYLEELKKISKGDKRIIFIPRLLNLEELNEFFNGIDLAVWARYNISVFEALGTNTPVCIPYYGVSSNLKGIKGVIFHGEDSRYFDEQDNLKDKQSFLKNIKRILEKRPKIKGKLDYERFGWEKIVEKIESLLRDHLKK